LALQAARRIATLLLCAAPEQLMAGRAADDPKPYPADKARGGEIILRARGGRLIFLAGLIGAMVLVLGFLR
jgi:hypothetical protein